MTEKLVSRFDESARKYIDLREKYRQMQQEREELQGQVEDLSPEEFPSFTEYLKWLMQYRKFVERIEQLTSDLPEAQEAMNKG